MADIDRSGFAEDVRAALKARNWSFATACAACTKRFAAEAAKLNFASKSTEPNKGNQ